MTYSKKQAYVRFEGKLALSNMLKLYLFHMKLDSPSILRKFEKRKNPTTLQSIMNAKLSLQGFWHCHENRLIKMIQTIPHNLYVIVKLTSLYYGLHMAYPGLS